MRITTCLMSLLIATVALAQEKPKPAGREKNEQQRQEILKKRAEKREQFQKDKDAAKKKINTDTTKTK